MKYSVFSHCFQLKTITIGKGLTSSDSGIFEKIIGYQYESLKEIIVSSDNQGFKSIDGVFFSKNQTILYAYPSNKSDLSYQIGEKVIEIWSYAFHKCSKLTNVIFGNNVITIGESAFEECSRLTYITFGKSVTIIDYSAFSYCLFTSIKFPENLRAIRQLL